jgi:hypothetical protein
MLAWELLSHKPGLAVNVAKNPAARAKEVSPEKVIPLKDEEFQDF